MRASQRKRCPPVNSVTERVLTSDDWNKTLIIRCPHRVRAMWSTKGHRASLTRTGRYLNRKRERNEPGHCTQHPERKSGVMAEPRLPQFRESCSGFRYSWCGLVPSITSTSKQGPEALSDPLRLTDHQKNKCKHRLLPILTKCLALWKWEAHTSITKRIKPCWLALCVVVQQAHIISIIWIEYCLLKKNFNPTVYQRKQRWKEMRKQPLLYFTEHSLVVLNWKSKDNRWRIIPISSLNAMFTKRIPLWFSHEDLLPFL